jgi:uncharacterized membrane protein YhhN
MKNWWLKWWPDLAMLGYYTGTVIVGVLAFNETSPALSRELRGGAILYAVGMVLMGVLATVSLFLGSRKSEAVAVGGMALLTGIHGIIILTASDTGLVTGLRLSYAPLMMIVWCHYRTQVVATRRDVQRHIDAVEGTGR